MYSLESLGGQPSCKASLSPIGNCTGKATRHVIGCSPLPGSCVHGGEFLEGVFLLKTDILKIVSVLKYYHTPTRSSLSSGLLTLQGEWSITVGYPVWQHEQHPWPPTLHGRSRPLPASASFYLFIWLVGFWNMESRPSWNSCSSSSWGAEIISMYITPSCHV